MSGALFTTPGAMALWLFAGGAALAQSGAATYGADSPQAVVAAVQKATAARDIAATLSYVTPAARDAIVKDVLGGTFVAMAMFDPEVPVVVGKPPSKAELETQRKNYKSALGELRDALKPHGLDSLVGKPVTPQTEAAFMSAINAALPKTDTVALARSVLAAMDRIAPLMGMPKPEPPPVFSFGAVGDYKIEGERATARAGGDTLEFERVQGRWYIKPPALPK